MSLWARGTIGANLRTALPAVLGKVTTAVDVPRGPDVTYCVRIPREWLVAGATVRVELPRNLACAQCAGGGCDVCGGAGALTLRGRNDPPESLEVTLPAAGDDPPSERSLTLRIPENGGHPAPDSGLPRGQLLLTLTPAGEAGPNVMLAPSAASHYEPCALPVETEPGRAPARWGLPALLAVALLLALLALLARMSGCGT